MKGSFIKQTATIAILSLMFAIQPNNIAHGFPLQEEAAIYVSSAGHKIYVIGTSQWHHSLIEALKKRGFKYEGQTSADHDPWGEERYCKISMRYDLYGKSRGEISNIHCAKDGKAVVRAFHYESPHYLEWLLDEVDNTIPR